MKFDLKLSVQSIDLISFIKEYLIAILFFAIIWARILSHSDWSMILANLLLAIVGIIGIVLMLFQGEKQPLIYLAFLLICWLFEFFVYSGKQYYDITNLVNTLFFFGVAYLLYTEKKNYRLYGLLYYGVALYFFIVIVVMKISYRELLADGNTYNYISCYVIFFFILYALALLSNGKKIGYISSILLFVVCISCYGRGGIVSALLYALGFGFIKFYEKRMNWCTYILLAGPIIILIIFSNRLISTVLKSATFKKFAIYGMGSNGRGEIWTSFFSNTMKNGITFLAGASPYDTMSDGNLHNSFLLMWASLGFIFFVANIIVIIIYTVRKIKSKELYSILVLWTFIVRAFTDKMMFRWYGEIILFYFVFETIKETRPKRCKMTFVNDRRLTIYGIFK